MIKEKLKGVFVPAITPFSNDEIQYKKLSENLKKINKTKVTGYLALGSNGEYKSLSRPEQMKVLEVFLENKEDKIIMAGTGCESTKETIEFSREAEKLGVDFVSVLTPSYFHKQIGDDILIDYYTEIAENISTPLLIYNAPGFAGGVTISTNAVKKLASHENIVGLKDSSPSGLIDFILATKNIENFSVLAGSINSFFIGLIFGATGGILSFSNAFPDICCKLYELYIENEIEDAKDLSLKLIKINNKISGKYGVSGVKTAVSLMGLFGGEPRRPLKPLNINQVDEIKLLLTEEFKKKDNY